MDYQDRLDKGARRTARMIDECIDAARVLCAAGDFDASAQAWEVAGHYCMAMAAGRRVSFQYDGGFVRPAAGDK